jgi:hypothetical protein
MNVTEEQFGLYLDVFHSSLQETAQRFIPDRARDLLHLSLLPARIVGYVSTQFGVAYEYTPAEVVSVEVVRGSARVEELLFDAPANLRSGPSVFEVSGRNAYFDNIGFSGRFPLRLAGQSASASLHESDASAGDWTRRIHHAELFGDRRAETWALDQAICRAKDEVLCALTEVLKSQHKALALPEYISRLKHKTVLLLGDYSDEGASRLEAIKASLEGLGYNPILLKEVPEDPTHSLPQKVTMLGARARFVVVDDSSKSGHIWELQTCKANDWVTVVLRKKGASSSFMTAGLSLTSKVILEQAYCRDSLDKVVAASVEWAEEELRRLEVGFKGVYPWRHGLLSEQE